MSDRTKAILPTLLALPVDERAEIAEELLASLEWNSDQEARGAPDAIDEQQLATILRRSEEVDNGTAVLISGDEAMRLFLERKKA